jgi:hypothetical protein
MLVSYGAMGMIISAVIPFIILFFFTLSIEKEDATAGAMLTPIFWIGFVVFIIYKLIAGWADNTNPLGRGEAIAYMIVVVASVLFILLKNKIISMIFKRGIEAGVIQKERANDATLAARITEKERLLAELVSSGKGPKSHAYLALEGEIEGLKKLQKKS